MHRTQVGLMIEFMYRICMSPGPLRNENNLQPEEFEEGEQEETSNRIPMVMRTEEVNVVVRPLGFCDDHNIYTSSTQGMKACMNVFAEVMAGLLIGFDEKVLLLMVNIRGWILDMLMRLQENMAPVFTDSETIKVRTSEDQSKLTQRLQNKIGSQHLYNLLKYVQLQLKRSGNRIRRRRIK